MTGMGDSVDQDVKANQAPPPITSGTYVSWDGGKGRVDLIVTNGKVPDVDGDTEGTADSPAARIVVWDQDGSGYKPSRKKVAAKTGSLKRIPPLNRAARKDTSAALVTLLADHDDAIEQKTLPTSARVTGRTVKTVFDRGVDAWPGRDATTLTAEEWAVGRVEAFLKVAAGGEVKFYHRDRDLLPVRQEEDVDLAPPTVEHVAVNPAEVKAALAALTG